MSCSLDIVIVNWNSGKRLRACLESIIKSDHSNYVLDRVTVVDNASTDASAVGLLDLDLPLTIITNNTNRGFATACNQGSFDSGSNYLLFLNPDTRLFPNSLDIAIAFMVQPTQSQVGICGARMLDEQGETVASCARFPTPATILGKVCGLQIISPRLFPPHMLSSRELAVSRSVDQVIGAFFMVRRHLFDELRGFDERFFVYFEEVDFSLRAREKGYHSYFLSDVRVFHEGGGCSRQAGANRLFYYLRSRLQFGLKHFSMTENIFLILLTLLVEPLTRSLAALRQRSLATVTETMSAYQKLVMSILMRKQWP
ncbi:MAG: glycosyltransferase family 2 protein [Thermoleophilia bacterium]